MHRVWKRNVDGGRKGEERKGKLEQRRDLISRYFGRVRCIRKDARVRKRNGENRKLKRRRATSREKKFLNELILGGDGGGG